MRQIQSTYGSAVAPSPRGPAQVIQSLLSRTAEEFGITDLCYYYDLAALEPWFQNQKDWQPLLRRMGKRRNQFTTSKDALRLWQEHVRHYASALDNLQGMFSQEQHLWRLDGVGNNLGRAMRRQGYRHKLTLSLPCPLVKENTGRFTLLMRSDDELARIRSALPALQLTLEEIQRTVSMNYSPVIHPLVDYNLISPVSAYILRLLASGESRESMAEEMNLTLRGIDYHMANLKAALGARNIANLVALGCRLRLI